MFHVVYLHLQDVPCFDHCNFLIQCDRPKAQMEKSKMSRGGAYRVAPPAVSAPDIYNVFKDHLAWVSDFGIYEGLSRNTQPDGAGLARLEMFLTALLKLAPCGEIAPGVIKKGFEQIVFEHPKLNTSAYHNGVWAGSRQERLTTVLYHVRRLHREPERFRQVAAKLTSAELNVLRHLVNMIEDSDSCSSSKKPKRSLDSQDAGSTQESPPRRVLQKVGSDVSVDSIGIPKMWASPAETRHFPSPKVQDKAKATDMAEVSPVKCDEQGFPDVFEDPRIFLRGDAVFQATLQLPVKTEPKAKAKAKAKGQPKAKAEAAAPAAPKATARNSDQVATATKAKSKAMAAVAKCAPKPEEAEQVPGQAESSRDNYLNARGSFVGTQQDWLISEEFKNAVQVMGVPEIKRRRFERHRLDLFALIDDKWELK